MKKIVLSLIVVAMMFVFCGLSFSAGPIIHDGSSITYYQSTDYNVRSVYEEFGTDSYFNFKTPNAVNFVGVSPSFSYYVYMDDKIKSVLPYIWSVRPDAKSFLQSGTSDFLLLEGYGSHKSDFIQVPFWNAESNQSDWKDSTKEEAYSDGLIFNSYEFSILRAYAWIGTDFDVNDTFGYTKAPIENFFGDTPTESDIEQYNTNITNNPNTVWVLYAHTSLQDKINEANGPIQSGQYSTMRIHVGSYVDSEPVFTFLD